MFDGAFYYNPALGKLSKTQAEVSVTLRLLQQKAESGLVAAPEVIWLSVQLPLQSGECFQVKNIRLLKIYK